MALPLVHLHGGPVLQGEAHGVLLRDRISHNLGLYFNRFEQDLSFPRDEVLRLAERYSDAIREQNRNYHLQMQGVARGAGFSLLDIVALNIRYEIFYYRFGKAAIAAAGAVREPEPDGCTAFAVLPALTESGSLLMGQNWDWIPDVQGAVVHTTDEDGDETLGFTEAGIVGTKIGLNSAGIGLAINGMTTTRDDMERMAKPFHVRCYEILRARTHAEAERVVTGEGRSCSTNFLIAQAPDKVTNIEAAPDVVNVLSCEYGCLTHANHFVAPESIGVKETPSERIGYSYAREKRLRELLMAATPLTVDKIARALRDTENEPFGLCRHRDWTRPESEHYTTVSSVIMNLDTRTLHITDGPPDSADYQKYQL